MKVKICGIKSLQTAKHAVESGADAIGFVFAPSKRRISIEQAKSITMELPEEIWKVGVFADEEPSIAGAVAKAAGLTHLQLHGSEDPKDFRGIGLPIIKSASITTKNEIVEINSINTDYLLLDSPPEVFKGGSGKSFDWKQAEGLGRINHNLILAGGLTPRNVSSAISIVSPFMVDVSSGVETNGEKDMDKIKEFIREAKRKEEEF